MEDAKYESEIKQVYNILSNGDYQLYDKSEFLIALVTALNISKIYGKGIHERILPIGGKQSAYEFKILGLIDNDLVLITTSAQIYYIHGKLRYGNDSHNPNIYITKICKRNQYTEKLFAILNLCKFDYINKIAVVNNKYIISFYNQNETIIRYICKEYNYCSAANNYKSIMINSDKIVSESYDYIFDFELL